METRGPNLPNRDYSSSNNLSYSPTIVETSDIPDPPSLTPSILYQSNKLQGPRRDPDPVIRAPSTTTLIAASTAVVPTTRYRECLKNHAASLGSHVVDGCGEFMPSGEEGTPEALKCAACECHRNFHRKEVQGQPQAHHISNSYYSQAHHKNDIVSRDHRLLSSSAAAPPPSYHNNTHLFATAPKHHNRFSSGLNIPPIMMAFSSGGAAESSSEDLNMFDCNTGREISVQMPKKRFRTKFTQEQKDRMMEFAKKLEWKIQKHDEEEVEQFCLQVGIKRKIFKVWMHNNKQAMKKEQT